MPRAPWIWSFSYKEVKSVSSPPWIRASTGTWFGNGMQHKWWCSSCELQGLAHLCSLSWNPIMATCEQAQGSPLKEMRDHVEQSLIIPTEAVLEPAYSRLTPNTGTAQSRSAELPTQESIADCRHTMSTDKSRRNTELIHRLIHNNKCLLLSHWISGWFVT